MRNQPKDEQQSILFVHPPGSYVDMPGLGIPSLIAHLRSHNVNDLAVWDANLDFIEYLLKPESLMRQEELIRQGKVRAITDGADKDLLLMLPYLRAHIEAGLKTFHDAKEYFDIEAYGRAVNLVVNSLSAYNVDDDPAEYGFNMNGFDIGISPSVENQEAFSTIQAIAESETAFRHMRSFLDQQEIPQLKRSYDLVAFSCPNPRQLLPAMILAQALKKSGVSKQTVIGGSYITARRNLLLKEASFYEFFDYAVTFEGEDAMLTLVNALEGNCKLSDVPNLHYCEHGIFFENEAKKIQSLDELATPDFSDFPLTRYWTPEPILPTYASRGCFYDVCEFCNHHENYFGKYRIRSTEKVIGDIETYLEKFGATKLFFVDELMVPKQQLEIAEQIKEKQLGTRWYAHSRVEKRFTKEKLELLAEGGVTLLHVGLESTNTRVLGLMKKGYTREEALKFLEDLQAVPLTSHLNTIRGFPGEQPEEYIETLETVWEYAKAGDFVHLYNFSFPEGAPLATSDNSFLEKVWKDSGDLNDSLSFSLKDVREGSEEESRRTSQFYTLLEPALKEANKIFPPVCCWAAHLLYVSNYRDGDQSQILDQPLSDLNLGVEGIQAFSAKEDIRSWYLKQENPLVIMPSNEGLAMRAIFDLHTFQFYRATHTMAEVLTSHPQGLISLKDVFSNTHQSFGEVRSDLYRLLRLGFISLHDSSSGGVDD